MTANSYCTLDDFLKWVTPLNVGPDYVDDVVIQDILEAVSRYIDDMACRTFYPRVETRSYDTPDEAQLYLDDDLLEVITLTNGDDTTIPSTEYNLIPKNYSPHYAIKLNSINSYYWTIDSSYGPDFAVDVSAIWGFHSEYAQRGWKTVTTLAEALDISELPWDLTDASTLEADDILRVGNELAIVASKSGNTATVKARGENGSTAATHDIAATVYAWLPMPEIKQACKQIAQNVYRRFGANSTDEQIVTAAGLVITPRDVPVLASRTIKTFARMA